MLSVFRRLDSTRQDAIIVIAECATKRARHPHTTKRPRPRLIERLRAAHACPKSAAPTFLQLPSTGHREWRCEACSKIVDLVNWANREDGAR
jgi:hypothetical protein